MQFSSRRHLPGRELSRERPFGSAPFHICSGPSASGASGGDVDLNGHSQIVRGKTGPSAVQRYRLAWIAHHRDTHEAAVADDPARRIEIDPAGAGQIWNGAEPNGLSLLSSLSGRCRRDDNCMQGCSTVGGD